MRPTLLLARNHEITARAFARCGLIAALTSCALAGWCAAARASGYLQIAPAGGAGRVSRVDLEQLPGAPPFDVKHRAYRDISTAGGAPRSVTVTGYSLAALLRSLQIAPSSFSFAEVLGPGGQSVLLTYAQATLSGAYPDGPPVVWQNRAGAHFLVPSLAPGGAYAGETFTGQNETITIDLHSGTQLSVGISSSSPTVAVGKPVRFTSSVSGAPVGASLSYQWSFGDGTGASAAAVSHAYPAAGTYHVYLRVHGSNDSLGISSVTPIVVGNAPKQPNPGAAGASQSTKTSSGGTAKNASGKGSGSRSATRSASRRLPIPRARPLAGPLVSGIAVADVNGPAARARGGAAAGSQTARTRHPSPSSGSSEGLWIALVALAMLFGGAILEWTGPPRPARAEIYG